MSVETESERFRELCKGDAEALDFLDRWAALAHRVDDIIDRDRDTPEDILATFVDCILLTSHPFYLRNLPHLRAVILSVVNMYADSVAWEKSSAEWQAQFANCYRHAANEVVIAVGQLCGGYEHARKFSRQQREICYATQHPEHNGKVYEPTRRVFKRPVSAS